MNGVLRLVFLFRPGLLLRSVFLPVLFVLSATVVAVPARAEFALESNDRVVIFGDAAVSDPLFSMALDQFLRLKYPDLKTNIVTLAKTGSSAVKGILRLELEVHPLAPTIVVLCFGLEDGGKRAFDQALLDQCLAAMSEMIDTFTQAGVKVVVMTPPPPEESKSKPFARAHYDEVVGKYAQEITKLAASRGLPVLDWNGAVKKHVAAHALPAGKHMTKDGLRPTGAAIPIALDLLLTHWQAEPIEYLISADWKTDNATVSTGSVNVIKRDDNHMVLALGDVPIPMAMYSRGTIAAEAWAMSKWCDYKLKIANLPSGGVIISQMGGANAKPFLREQLARGADVSSIGPLASHKAVEQFRRMLHLKLQQVRQFRDSCNRRLPEPEFEEAYALYRRADMLLALAAHEVLGRTATTFGLSVEIKLAGRPAVVPGASAGSKAKANKADKAKTKPKPARKIQRKRAPRE